MTPQCGAGSGQAIDVCLVRDFLLSVAHTVTQDAFVLGRLITHPLATLSWISDVFRIYEAIRLPFAQTVARYSLSTGWLYLFMEPGYYDGARKEEGPDDRGMSTYEREGMDTMKQEILRRWQWMEESKSALHAWVEPEGKLQALLGQAAD